jgi:uncharacterized membrane protein YgdD (TMEM256/DUF423 family)
MKTFAFLGAANAALAVAAGAFAAHGLRERLEPRHLEIFETGARYHMYHALGLLAVAWLAGRGAPAAAAAGWTMLAGIAIFSGSLYLLAITGVSKLGAITPIGGLALLAAWALVAYGALRLPT